MYIVPNSKVYILSGIPINNNYQHTIYFDDADTQYAYFRKHVKKMFTGVSYQREKRGWMPFVYRPENGQNPIERHCPRGRTSGAGTHCV